MTDRDELTRLRAENARLVALLESHGIAWQAPAPLPKPSATLSLSTDEKVALFGRLFRGRTDVYPVRWNSKAGKSGYSPACANEWRPGVCEKPRIKCSDCHRRQLLPLTDQVLFDHLAGRHTIGLYPLLSGDDCHLLAVEFDKSDWRDDARAFVQSCRELDVPVALEISRSGNGAHEVKTASTSSRLYSRVTLRRGSLRNERVAAKDVSAIDPYLFFNGNLFSASATQWLDGAGRVLTDQEGGERDVQAVGSAQTCSAARGCKSGQRIAGRLCIA